MKVPVQLEFESNVEGSLSAKLPNLSAITISDGMARQPEEGYLFEGDIYLLSEYDYQSIKQDFELLIKRDPRVKSALDSILQKMHCKMR